MPGDLSFDDLIPQAAPQSSAAPSLSFDDLIPQKREDEPSAWGAAARHAAASILPSAAGMAGFGAGAEAGAGLGALTGPAAPIAVPVLGLIGGLGGAYAASEPVSMAQEAAIKALPKGAQEAIGQSEEDRRADEAAHPYASLFGDLIPQAAFMSPGTGLKLAQRAVGAGLSGVQEAVSEERSGEGFDPGKLAISTAAGALMTHETGLGSKLSGAGKDAVGAVGSVFKSEKATAPGVDVNVQTPPPPSAPGAGTATAPAPVPTPTSAPDPGATVGIKFPKAPSQRATIDSYWDDGQSVRVRYDNGETQDMLTHELLRDQTAPPPPLADVPHGPDLGAAPTEAERFDLWDEADRAAPPNARPGAVQPQLGTEAIEAIRHADALEQQANDPNSRLSDQDRYNSLMAAQQLRSQFGHVAGPIDVTPEQQAAANAARPAPDTLLGNVPPVNRAPPSFTPEELAAAAARGAAPETLISGVPGAERAPVNFSPAELAAARANPGSTGNVLGQEVPNLPRQAGQFTPQELAAADAARKAAAVKNTEFGLTQPTPAPTQVTPPGEPIQNSLLVKVPPVAGVKDLVGWIRANGGIKDTDGDIEALYRSQGKRAPPGIITNINGTPPDVMATYARDQGYFPEHPNDPNAPDTLSGSDLIQAIEDHLNGTPRYSTDDVEQLNARQAAQAYNDQIKAQSTQHGVDYRNTTLDQFQAGVKTSEMKDLAARIGIPTEGQTPDDIANAIADHLSLEQHSDLVNQQAAADDAADQEATERYHRELGDAWEGEPTEYDVSQPRTLEDLTNEHAQSGTDQETRPGDVGEISQRVGGGEAANARGDQGRAVDRTAPEALPGEAGEGTGPKGLAEHKGPQFDFGPRKTPQIEKTEQGDQYVLPGAERSAQQAAAARGEMLAAKARQKPADEGLFAPKEPVQPKLFEGKKEDLESGPTRANPRPTVETLRDLHDFAANADRSTKTPEEANATAADYVMSRGAQTGHEFAAVVDAKTGEIVSASTNGEHDAVDFTPRLLHVMIDPDADLVIHHNHPNNSSLSGTDINVLRFPGVNEIVAHGHDGDLSSARLTDDMNVARHRNPQLFINNVLRDLHDQAYDAIDDYLRNAVRLGLVKTSDAERLFTEIVGHSLAAAGVTDHIGTRDLGDINAGVLNGAIEAGAAAAIDSGRTNDLPVRSKDDARLYRPAEPIQPDVAVADISRRSTEETAGRYRGPAYGPMDSTPDGSQAEAGRGPSSGLAETDEERYRSERAGPQYATRPEQPATAPQEHQALDGVSHDIAQAAAQNGGGGGDPPSIVARQAERMMPQRTGDAMRKTLGWLNNKFIMPRTLATMDSRSARFWQAWNDKLDTARSLQHRWSDDSQDYAALTSAQRDKLSAVEELDRATGTRRRDDGRQIVARNEASSRLEMSKPGQSIILDPATTAVYHQRREMFNDVWNTLMQSSAKKLWPAGLEYNGTTDPKEVMAKAVATDSKPLKKQLTNIADLLTGMQEHRNMAYTPLMRFGDYYIAIKPKPGTQGADAMNWDGNGFPPTARFELVDSKSSDTMLDRIAGKNEKEGVVPQPATDRIAELRQRYPEADYDLEAGYLKRNADALRKLDIPAIEKMFIALQQEDSKLFGPMVDEMRDKMYGELQAGFKRQAGMVPGYDTNFARATGAYINWTSNHSAELQHGDNIRSVQENFIDTHPDKRIRLFWQKWSDYQNNPAEEMQRLRQFGFYWQMAMNPASTLSVATHGPLVAHATLGAGVGYGVAGKHLYGAFGDALKNVKFDAKVGAHIDMDQMGRTPAERALIKDATSTGLVHPSMEEDMRGLGQGAEGMMGVDPSKWKRVLKVLSSNIAVADQMNRVGTLLGSYRLASQPGVMDKIAKTWGNNQVFREMAQTKGLTPENVAKFMVDEGLFVWGKTNRAEMQRGVGAAWWQFKNFEANLMGTLWKFSTRMGPEGKSAAAFMLTGMGLLGGALAAPFTDDIVKASDAAYKTITGIDPMIESKIYQLMENAGMSKLGAEAVLRGPSRSLFNVDLGSRLGLGDVVSRNMTAADALGTVPSMVYQRVTSAINRAQHGQTTAAVADLLPTAARNVVRATGVLPKQGLQSQYGNTVVPKNRISTGDQVAQGLGFETATSARAYEQKGFETRSAQAARDLTGRLTSQVVGLEGQIIDANRRGDTGQAAKLSQQMQQIYHDNPEVKISRQAVGRGIERLTNPESVSLKQGPKTSRNPASPYPGTGPQLRADGGRIHAAAAQADREPSEAQIRAGNYKMGHTSVHGMPVTIENAKGSLRRGVGKDGKPWEAKLGAHYGYLKRTVAADGDHLDVFLGPDHDSKRVFVIDQLDADTGKYDEAKCCINFSNMHKALEAYHASFSDGRGIERAGNVRTMTTAQFKGWLENGNTKRPMAA